MSKPLAHWHITPKDTPWCDKHDCALTLGGSWQTDDATWRDYWEDEFSCPACVDEANGEDDREEEEL